MHMFRKCGLIMVSFLVILLVLSCGGPKKESPAIKIKTPKKIDFPELLKIGDTTKADIIDLAKVNLVKEIGEKYEEYVAKYVKVAGKAEYYSVDGYTLEKQMIAELYGKEPPEVPMRYIVVNIFTDHKETITILANSDVWGNTIKKMPFNQKVEVYGKLSATVSKNTFSVVVDE